MRNSITCLQQRARHVPYRDSKLTFLLRESLGGNSRTCNISTSTCTHNLDSGIRLSPSELRTVSVSHFFLFIGALVSGAQICEAETLSTLKFALCAKSVKNRFVWSLFGIIINVLRLCVNKHLSAQCCDQPKNDRQRLSAAKRDFHAAPKTYGL